MYKRIGVVFIGMALLMLLLISALAVAQEMAPLTPPAQTAVSPLVPTEFLAWLSKIYALTSLSIPIIT